MQSLPIDSVLDRIVSALREHPAVVVEAPPGSGKSTRVPLALLEAGLATEGEIVVTEPRRLAARLTASHVARLLGEPLGERVGYSVRFENKTGPNTRIRYATEGVILRQLLRDAAPRIPILVLDEFHERHLQTDLLLALVRARQARDPLTPKLVIMSATLDGDAVSRYLGGCPRVQAAGRLHPISIDHLAQPDDRSLEKQVASAARRALQEGASGDILVFLPGAREIARSTEALGKLAQQHALDLRPLHGDMPLADQALAVNPGPRRKIVLSTNVAESSVTIDGVTTVIDSGLARTASHSPWSGLPTLSVQKISRASAEQRAGRAGRTRPGQVLRLFTSGDLRTRPEQDRPELQRLELTEVMLYLAGAGLELGDLPWLDPPPAASADAARELLQRLGALDRAGRITRVGGRMLKFPVPPRLARTIVRGEELGVAADAALTACLLGERDIRADARTRPGRASRPAGPSGPSDVLELMDRYHEGDRAGRQPHRLQRLGLDPRAMHSVRQAASRLQQIVRNESVPASTTEAIERGILRSILAGFPDRVAKRRGPDSRELVLASGKSASLAEESVVQGSLLVALDAEERGRQSAVVRLASEIDPEWLLEDHERLITLTSELVLNRHNGQVEAVSTMSYGSIVLEEERSAAPPSEAASLLISREALSRFDRTAGFGEVRRRLELIAEHVHGVTVPPVDDALVEALFADRCTGITRLGDLDAIDWVDALLHQLGPTLRDVLRRDTPTAWTLPGGRPAQVHYEAGRPPWLASRLQDFFGMTEGPAVCAGRVPVVLHLLAPNGRAVQVTTDLTGFWDRHYPTLRRELGRRYPKHSWPEDGRTASPPPLRRPRR